MNRWWEKETPKVVNTSKNILRWYPRAGKLQVARPDWTDDKGIPRTGKTVVLDIEALREVDDAAALLREVMDAI